jgi:hypothetical protein
MKFNFNQSQQVMHVYRPPTYQSQSKVTAMTQ